MNCPNCGKSTKVIKSAPENGERVRYRKCKPCGLFFKTLEVRIDERPKLTPKSLETLKKVRIGLRNIINTLNRIEENETENEPKNS